MVPSSIMTYPPPIYHRPTHRFSLSQSAAAANNSSAACPQSYYPHHVGNPAAAAAAMYGPYDGFLHSYVPSDPCKQALMMASQAAGFSGMGGDYNACIGM